MAKKKRSWPPLDQALPVAVTDNHTHLPVHDGEIPSPEGIKLSVEEQLDRADQVGVRRLITVGCELPDFEPTLELARRWTQVKVALAIHPNEAPLHAGVVAPSPDGNTWQRQPHHIPLDQALEQLEKHLSDPEVVAVGETGLDYYRTGAEGVQAQKESFRAHLEMARGYGLPLQIHDRDAHADTLEILEDKAWNEVTTVFHCYSGDAQMAQRLAENSWYASFAGPLTYPANEELRKALLAMPKELVLVETDAPYLTPVPYRGCPNASYVMPHTVRAIAELWGWSVEETASQLENNTVRVYGRW